MPGRWTIYKSAASTLLAGFLCLAACSPDNGSDAAKRSAVASNVTLTDAQQKNIHLYTVKEGAYRKAVDAVGAVEFDNDRATSVLAPFSGPVTRILVSTGERVTKGQPLAIVASPDFAASVSAYRKAVAAAATASRLAEMDKDLVAHKAVSQREADQAQSDAVGAEADRAAALQGLVALGIDPRAIAAVRSGRLPAHIDGVIRAPIAGRVVEKRVTPGQLIEAGTTACFTIADLSRVWVMAQVFASDLASVRVGDPAIVSTGFATLAGRVDNIASEVDPDTRSVAVRIVVDNPAGILKKQMYVRARIEARTPTRALTVPVSAVLRDDENLPFVYARQKDGSFARRQVSLGDRAGGSYAIVSGLRAGERIVADGALFLQFMQEQ